MIEIDGSYGEGGGQILRTSIALSAVTGQDVHIANIRANRPKPGLAPSHITSIEAVARICDAEGDNLFAGSKDVVFRPRQLTGGDFEFDVGTAGSISMIIQSCLLPAVLSKARIMLTVKGGTDVRWSPPIDFMRLIHLQMLAKFGPVCHLDIESRGFYPEGGGAVELEVSPVSRLAPISLDDRGKVEGITGIAFAQNLPEHVVTRMKHSALKRLIGQPDVRIDSQLSKGPSTGAGIVLAAECSGTVLAASALGERGVKAETLGEGCADDLLETMRSGATVDENMLDQIIPYMALAGPGCVVLAEEMTGHAETNLWVTERFLGKRFSVSKIGALVELRTI
ncbi:MAG: RNA 3'-terminal-phosphate cyclase [Euryarchaeota archaeon RBG_19FT_COMBO_56_21]|nr:MAG: RNA 3'-terminal-phosphate cyclase [Euryarchaeota archaeon RBG_19FT_COMBO_56_21]